MYSLQLKEGVWPEPIQAALRRKKTMRQAPQVDEEIGRGRRLGSEERVGHWLVGRTEKCRACNKEEGMEKHRLYHPPQWKEVRNQILENGKGE